MLLFSNMKYLKKLKKYKLNILLITFAIVVLYSCSVGFNFSGKTRFCVIVPVYNAIEFLEPSLKSIEEQKYPKRLVKVCIVEDNSTKNRDNIRNMIKYYCRKNNWEYIFTESNKGPMNSRVIAIEKLAPSPEDVIVCLDGDDKLHTDQVFNKLDSVYSDEITWITFGNYIKNYGNGEFKPNYYMNNCNHDWEKIKKENSYRKEWLYSHLKTFKYKLYNKIDHDEFKKNGKYITSATDLALMYPMLEQSQGRFKCIPDILYEYTINNPESFHNNKKKEKEQKENGEYVSNKTN